MRHFFIFFSLIALNVSAQTKNFHDWAQKPPMGWNSYNCFGAAVVESEVRANAKMMEAHLKDSGWEYIVIDYMWFYPNVGALNNPAQSETWKPGLVMDKYGRLQPCPERFPSSKGGKGFKNIADDIHSRGLKFGIHIMRGIPREAVAKKLPVKGTKFTADQIADITSICSWSPSMYGIDMTKQGAQEYYNSIINMYASWGVDYIKADDISSPYYEKEIEALRKAIDNCGRRIVLSLSPGNKTPVEKADHVKAHANMWRVSEDFWDEWPQLKHNFELVHKWEKHIGNGHFPDADMIPFGLLSIRGPEQDMPRRSRFTDTEKYTLMSLWCIARSPLMYGGDLMHMRPVELKLLTNREVLDVNQNSKNNRQLSRDDDKVVWVADIPGSDDKYVAIFNLSDENQVQISVSLDQLGLSGKVTIRNLWEKRDLGSFQDSFSFRVNAHQSLLLKVKPLN